MRLELRPVGSQTSLLKGAKWYLERGQRTLGRAPDCDWQLPTEQRSISKLHCTIERDRDGFILRDQSANGSRVDDIIVHEGETARLSDQSCLQIGELAFSIHISGESHREIEDPDSRMALSDEPLTISAILADISPGGHMARGVLGERTFEDWLEPQAGQRTNLAPSHNIEIGWSGPPEILTPSKLLPDDWNTEGSSDYSSRLEHGAATHIAIPIPCTRVAESLESVNDNAPSAGVETEEGPPLSIGQPSTLVQRLEPLMDRLEEAIDSTFGVFDMESPTADSESFDDTPDRRLIVRVEALLHRQNALNAALKNLLQYASHAMEPRVLEARVDSGRRQLSFSRNTDYWRAYRAQFERNGGTLSVRDIFHEVMMRRTDDTTAPTARLAPQGKPQS